MRCKKFYSCTYGKFVKVQLKAKMHDNIFKLKFLISIDKCCKTFLIIKYNTLTEKKMPQLLEPKEIKGVPYFTVWDSFAVAGLKIVSERALAKVPFVGNATIKSGIIKAGLSLVMTGFSPTKEKHPVISKAMGYEGVALMVDAGEDVLSGVLGRFSNTQSNANATNNSGEIGTSNQGMGVQSVI